MKHKILKEEFGYNGFLKVKKLEIEHDRFDGGKMSITRELVLGGSAAHVLIVDKKIKKALMISQFRTGLAYTDNAWSLEAVAGLIDPNETPIEAAIRECKEETGMEPTLEQITHVTTAHPSFGDCNKVAHIFIADMDLSNVDVTETHGEASEHEDIKVELVDFETLFNNLRNNKIQQLQDVIAIQRLMIELF